MALDQAVLAARDRETPAPHRLHLAVAHAGQVGAHDIGSGLKHPFLVCESLRIEALAPRPTAVRIDRDRRVHAADLYPQLGRHCVDQPRFTACQQKMRARLGLHVDPDMEMQEMGVDRWGHCAGVGVDAQLAVMSGAPDRRAAPLAASAAEIGLQAGAATRSEEHTSELQSLMRNSYAVFGLKKKKNHIKTTYNN